MMTVTLYLCSTLRSSAGPSWCFLSIPFSLYLSSAARSSSLVWGTKLFIRLFVRHIDLMTSFLSEYKFYISINPFSFPSMSSGKWELIQRFIYALLSLRTRLLKKVVLEMLSQSTRTQLKTKAALTTEVASGWGSLGTGLWGGMKPRSDGSFSSSLGQSASASVDPPRLLVSWLRLSKTITQKSLVKLYGCTAHWTNTRKWHSHKFIQSTCCALTH